jgi:hypothetical protein
VSWTPAANVAVYAAEEESEPNGDNAIEFDVSIATLLLTGFWAASFNVRVEVFNVAWLMFSSNVTVILASMSVQVEPLEGDSEITLGAVVSGAKAVVNVQARGVAMAFPEVSFAPKVIVAV